MEEYLGNPSKTRQSATAKEKRRAESAKLEATYESFEAVKSLYVDLWCSILIILHYINSFSHSIIYILYVYILLVKSFRTPPFFKFLLK